MAAETLKPFLTPGDSYVTASHSSGSSVHHRRSRYIIAIVASTLFIMLVATLLGLTVWNTMRIANMQTEVENLNRVIESMQKRLGLTYLDDLNDLEKEDENHNHLIDDILSDDDDDDDVVDDDDFEHDTEMANPDNYDEDDDDEDEDYTYDELIKKLSDYSDEDDDDIVDDEDDYDKDMDDTEINENSRNVSRYIKPSGHKIIFDYNEDDDGDKNSNEEDTKEEANLYNDFEKFKESTRKSKGDRKTRSVTDTKNVEGNNESDFESSHRSHNQKSIVSGNHYERRHSPMRPYNSRRRKIPLTKSGPSLISAKTLTSPNAFNEIELNKPAAHFHLTHKVPYHHSQMRVHTYNGDMYIGKPSWSNERDALDTFFHVENGVLTVHESGLYYVYAQVCYNNHFAQNGFIIFHGHKPFLQCLSNIFTNGDNVINTCHTSGLIYLKRDEHIHIRDFHADRKAFLEETNNRSYFGLIKI